MRKDTIKMNWFYIAVSLMLFILFAAAVIYIPETTYYDRELLTYIQGLLVQYPTFFAQRVSNFGGECWLLWPQLTALSALFSHKKYFDGILLVIFTQIAWHFTDFIKDYVKRERPCGNEMNWGYSFPSGHSVTTMCFYGIVIYLVLHYVKNKFWRYFLTTICGLFIFLVMISRWKLNVHYPTDVFAGLCWGFMLVNLYIIIQKFFEK